MEIPHEQHRGSGEAYARYLASMDASMRQKVALTAAHLICKGRVADMGMGSGSGTLALAELYPDLEVIGVDLDPEMVALARARHVRPNLGFVQGDVAAPVFEDGSLDGLLDSSVLHHVTSFGGYRHEAAAEALAVQARALRPHGVLVIRDFVAPEDGGAPVVLELPPDDGDATDDPATCSSAALLRRFAGEFRSLSSAPGFACEELPPRRDGWRRFRLSHRHAVEFLLRKDYRRDWVQEVKEEYTWCTQRGCEALLARLGLRLLASTPIRNPWIVAHRWEGRVALSDARGEPLPLPPTNYLAAAERVPAREGVRFRARPSAAAPRFLSLEQRALRDGGGVRDVVRRPHLTLDVLPHFDRAGDTYVIAKVSYPRPLLATGPAAALDGSTPCPYVTEPLSALQDGRPLGQLVEAVLARFGVTADRIRRLRPGGTYFPSPGGVEEEVHAVRVEIEPTLVQDPPGDLTGFSTSGRARAIEARQLLRAAQVGGLADARLELNVHELLLELGRGPGPWIGAEVAVAEGAPVEATPLAALEARPPRRAFTPAPPAASPGFLALAAYELEELSASGEPVARGRLEAVTPLPVSPLTVATALLRRDARGVYLGLDDADLAAAQGLCGHSSLLVTPAWRLPHAAATPDAARAFLAGRLEAEHGVRPGRWFELGGRYHPTPGATPEVVHPWAVEVAAEAPAPRPLRWVLLRELVARRAALVDGHLRVVALRAAHALGLLAGGEDAP
ncbi:MAG: class I SAM-dependent methyltransferase [Anaeromyxobacter sp.]